MTDRRPSFTATGNSSRSIRAIAREQTWLILVALLTLVPFAALGIWAHSFSPAPWEPGVLKALAAGPGLLGTITGAINTLGNMPVWAAAVAITAVAIGLLRGLTSAALVALSIASDLAAFAVKVAVQSARPDTVATRQFFGPDSFSFPSGHTVRAVALVAAVVWVLAPPRARLPLAIVGGLIAGVVMGYARVSLGVHWPTDVIGGALLGMGWFALTALGVDYLKERQRTKR